MLVLTRKYQEKIQIGDNITITVLRTKGKAVRLGIEAPSDVPVVRGELKFETDPAAVELVLEKSEQETAASNGRSRGPREVAASNWTTKSRAANPSRLAPAETGVEHRRVARQNVPQLLPRLISGNGTLREMLDQRTTAR